MNRLSTTRCLSDRHGKRRSRPSKFGKFACSQRCEYRSAKRAIDDCELLISTAKDGRSCVSGGVECGSVQLGWIVLVVHGLRVGSHFGPSSENASTYSILSWLCYFGVTSGRENSGRVGIMDGEKRREERLKQ